MKRTITFLLTLFVSAPLWAAVMFEVTVSGTISTQQVIEVETGKIVTKPFNNARIYQEFGVSSQDYALVLNASSNEILLLIPRDASSGLTNIVVVEMEDQATLLNTVRGSALFGAVVRSDATDNVFEGFVGAHSGSIKVKGALETENITKVAMTLLAQGSGPGGNGQSLFKLKITTGQRFEQTGVE
jgi:hypothetical protein